jgi:hypothetical protein
LGSFPGIIDTWDGYWMMVITNQVKEKQEVYWVPGRQKGQTQIDQDIKKIENSLINSKFTVWKQDSRLTFGNWVIMPHCK